MEMIVQKINVELVGFIFARRPLPTLDEIWTPYRYVLSVPSLSTLIVW